MQLKAIVCTTSTKNSYAMHTVKLLLTYYLNISVQAANIYQTAESNRIETFLPKLECSSSRICYVTLRCICLFSQPDVTRLFPVYVLFAVGNFCVN